jgi:hypothetical protein
MKPKLKRTLSAVALMAALVFVLTGCIHMNMSLTLNKDDSVDWGYEMLMSDTILSMAGDSSVDPWAEATVQAEAEGFKVEKVPSNADGYSGIKVVKHYATIDDFNNDTKKLSGTEGTAGNSEATFSLTKKDGVYSLVGSMDASKSMDEQTKDMDDATKEMMQPYLDQIQFNFMMTLPFKAETNNATSVSSDGLTYTWKMDLTKANDIQLTAKAGGGTNLLLIGGIAAAGVIVIVAIVLIAVAMSKKKKATASAEQQPPIA